MTVTLIDTFGFFFRSFYALPPLKSRSGHPTGLLTGFVNFIATLAKDHATDYLVFCLDSKTPSFRSELFTDYKGHRPEVPEDLKLQLPVAISWIEKMGFRTVTAEAWEADDVIASLATAAKRQGLKVRIVSHDKDLYQLIDDGKVVLWDPMKKAQVDEDKCVEKYGVTPAQFIDYQSLVGDSADNIPGVRGIGPKTAAKLIADYGTLEGIYDNLASITPKGVQEKLAADRENAMLSRTLVRLATDLYPTVDFRPMTFPAENPILAISDELLAYDMGGSLSRARGKTPLPSPRPDSDGETRVDSAAQPSGERFDAVTVANLRHLEEVIASIPADAVVAFDTETDDLDTKKAALVGFSFAWEHHRGYYVPVGHSYLGVEEQIALDEAAAALRRLMCRPIIGHNLKFDLALVERIAGVYPAHIAADTMLMAWLADPGQSVGLDALAHRYMHHTMISFSETVKKGATFASVDIGQATRYAAEDAVMTLRLFAVLSSRLSPGLLREMHEVEIPFIRTLIGIERRGIMIDPARFETLSAQLSEAIERLTREIWEHAGGEFNINSTQQLGGVLFEKLALPTKKKTKTGYSTDEKVLSELADAHPIIPLLLEYRELFKLRSTYAEPLLALGHQRGDHRIHTSFLQTGTATGRLASRNPNLQNIPVRSEWGRKVRDGFVAAPGMLFIGIDYSQIELRLLAHFSGDPVLTEAFVQGRDIHLETARRLFGDELAKTKRPIAKTINFGILYGMGSRKLADDLGISTKEAKEIIDHYFASFATIRGYLESIRTQAKDQGYVTTLLGRRRNFDFAHASAMQEAMYLREAVNTVFQGTAADIIKLAMNAIEGMEIEAKIILQIHDELIFEVPQEQAEAMARRLAAVMEGIVPLAVPLKTSIEIGRCWGELK